MEVLGYKIASTFLLFNELSDVFGWDTEARIIL